MMLEREGDRKEEVGHTKGVNKIENGGERREGEKERRREEDR